MTAATGINMLIGNQKETVLSVESVGNLHLIRREFVLVAGGNSDEMFQVRLSLCY